MVGLPDYAPGTKNQSHIGHASFTPSSILAVSESSTQTDLFPGVAKAHVSVMVSGSLRTFFRR